MFFVSKKYEISCAHWLEGHEKCGRLHGHNYIIEPVFTGNLDIRGMLVDFHDIDEVVKPILDELDHHLVVGGQQVTYADAVQIPMMAVTAECLANYICNRIRMKLPNIYEVTVWETSKCRATYRPDN